MWTTNCKKLLITYFVDKKLTDITHGEVTQRAACLYHKINCYTDAIAIFPILKYHGRYVYDYDVVRTFNEALPW